MPWRALIRQSAGMHGLERIPELKEGAKPGGGTFNDGNTWDEIIRILEEEALSKPAIAER